MLHVNPIIVKELRSRMRGGRPYLVLSAYLLGLGIACYGIIEIFQRQASSGATIMSAHVGQGLFAALALAMTLLITFITPALTAGAISSEREQLTYDLLIATPLAPTRILSGKLIAALWYVGLLLFAAVPLGSLILVFGGIAPRDLLKAGLLLALTALATGSLGVLCSALAKRTLRATIMAYLIMMALLAAAYFVVMLRTASAQMGPPPTSRIVAVSPFSAMTSIVMRGNQINGAMPMMEKMGVMFDPNMLMNTPPFSTFSFGLIDYNNQNGPLVRPVYREAYVAYTLFSLLCYWLAMHMVRPRWRWRLGWSDLVLLLLVVGITGAGMYWLHLGPWAAKAIAPS